MDNRSFLINLLSRSRSLFKARTGGIVVLVTLVGIVLTRSYSYLLFHTLAEMFSVVVAFGVFIVAWNSVPLVKNYYPIILGIGSLFIALIDLVHSLSYKGMGVFPGYDANLPTQLWLAARYLQALTLLVAPLFLRRRTRKVVLLAIFTVITTGLFASIFFFKVFPIAYIEGLGLTPFKIVSEYIIVGILVAAIGLLWRNRSEFDSTVLNWLIGSIVATAAAEIAFTSYVGVTDTSNLLGHFFKIIAFYLLYRALVETGFVRPYSLIFRQIKLEEEAARKAHGEAEERLADLRSLSLQIMETMGQGLTVTDHEEKFEYVNPAFASLVSRSQQDLLGKHPSETIVVDEQVLFQRASAEGLQGKTITFETRLLGSDGRTVPVLVTSVPRLLDDKPAGMISVITDITFQKQSETRLRQSNRALTMLKDCNQILVRADNETELMQKMCEIIVQTGGYCMAWVGFTEQDGKQGARSVAQFGIEENGIKGVEIAQDGSNQDRIPVSEKIKNEHQSSIVLPLKNAKSTFGSLTIYASTADAFDSEELSLLTELADDLAYGITTLREREKHRLVEEQIREMALFPALNPDPVLQVDTTGQVKKSNSIAVEMGLGSGAQLTDILPDFNKLDLPACIETGIPHLNYETQFEDGFLQWTVRGVPDLGLAFLYSKDITKRKQAEQEAEARAKEWKDTFDAINEFVSVHDTEFKIVRANKALADRFGKKPDELIGIYCYQLFHGINEPWPNCPHAQAMKLENAVTEEVDDPSIGCPLMVSVSPVFDQRGQVTGGVHIAKDITERKRAEQRIELERAKLKNILDTMSDGVYIVDQNFEIEYTNPALEREFGRVAGRRCYQYLHNLAETCPWCVMEKVLQGEVNKSERSSNDKIYELLDTPLKNSDGSISKLGIRHDITLLKRNEDRLKQANLKLKSATQAERTQRQLAEALVDAAFALNKSLKLDDVLPLILEKINEAIPYELAAITLLEGDTFYDACRQGGDLALLFAPSDADEPYPLDDFPLLVQMRQSGQPVRIQDTHHEPDWINVEGFEWCRSFLSAPLVVEEQVIGFVNLFAGQPDFFTQETCDRLVAFAAHAAVAIQNAWLVERIKAGSERLQSLSHRLVNIQEKERQLIARELHDEAGQMLTSLKLDLHLLGKNASQPDRVSEKVIEMENSVNEILENLHRLAVALRPASLDHLGLVTAIRQHVESVAEKQEINVNFKSDELQERLPPNVETVLYRIVQEALTNIIRHAQATQVDVLLTAREGKLMMLIEDNGIGFDPERLPAGEHLGLFSMRERAEMIGGNLMIESTPGYGTTIKVEAREGDLLAAANSS